MTAHFSCYGACCLRFCLSPLNTDVVRSLEVSMGGSDDAEDMGALSGASREGPQNVEDLKGNIFRDSWRPNIHISMVLSMQTLWI